MAELSLFNGVENLPLPTGHQRMVTRTMEFWMSAPACSKLADGCAVETVLIFCMIAEGVRPLPLRGLTLPSFWQMNLPLFCQGCIPSRYQSPPALMLVRLCMTKLNFAIIISTKTEAPFIIVKAPPGPICPAREATRSDWRAVNDFF